MRRSRARCQFPISRRHSASNRSPRSICCAVFTWNCSGENRNESDQQKSLRDVPCPWSSICVHPVHLWLAKSFVLR